LIHNDQTSNVPALLQSCLGVVRENLPVVDRTISQYGDLSLREYLTNFSRATGASFQSRDDILDIVFRYVAPLLGNALAKDTTEDLAALSIILTSNHHGVDYYAQTLQSRLIFSFRSTMGLSSARTVPIFACGNIPLNNLTYPRGLLLYRGPSRDLDAIPFKLPLFPDRLKRTMVNAAQAYDETMVGNLQCQLDKMIRKGEAPSDVGAAARTILVEDYRFAALAAVPDYSQQAVILNNLIWKRLFARGFSHSEMIYLEMEKIVDALLARDLSNPASLAWSVLFDPALRENVVAELDGTKGCWNREVLGQRFLTKALPATHLEAGKYCGTVFFWGVDCGGRRIPLSTARRSFGEVVFRGVDDQGTALEIPLTPEAISKSLQERQMVPSLFTSFMVLSFARGVGCVGGYLQGEYLPQMQRGLAAALETTPGYRDVAQVVLQAPTTLYLDGMIGAMSRMEDGLLIPAGPVEIVAGGGLTEEDIMTMLSLTVREAHLADLFETFTDGAPPELRTTGWKKRLALAGSAWLEGKVVVK
jgi:hypothetical protein